MPRETRPFRVDTDGHGRPIRATAAVQAGAATVEDIRRAYYDQTSVPMSYWITEIQVAPPQLIVCDEQTADIYRVPVTVNGAGITFGAPVQVQREFVDAPAAKTTAAARWGSPVTARAAIPAAGTRPPPRPAQPSTVADPADADYERLFGREPVQVQAGARNVPAPKRPAARPFRETEAEIAAAIADGKIPRSRVPFYRDLAAKGDDLSVLGQLAATPGLVLAGTAPEDPEDAVYADLFGGAPGDRSGPVGAAEQAEDSQYRRLFPTASEERARADARLAAAQSATAALSDQQLMREMFGQED